MSSHAPRKAGPGAPLSEGIPQPSTNKGKHMDMARLPLGNGESFYKEAPARGNEPTRTYTIARDTM
jgi:hypothetical protein